MVKPTLNSAGLAGAPAIARSSLHWAPLPWGHLADSQEKSPFQFRSTQSLTAVPRLLPATLEVPQRPLSRLPCDRAVTLPTASPDALLQALKFTPHSTSRNTFLTCNTAPAPGISSSSPPPPPSTSTP
ncbi:hypothetical protein B0T13DRAFT_286565 [Neurospora crassa]|nr:hypothetical protein B0T13DRAFT_286565 [Neurospora crassa]